MYDLLNVKLKPKFLWILYANQILLFFFYTEKELFKGKRKSGWLNKKRNEDFLTALTLVTKNDLTRSIRKLANELKVQEKVCGQQLKKIQIQTLTFLIGLYGCFKKLNKPNFPLKTAIEKE